MASRKVVPISLPVPHSHIDRWIILALDPSLSRTGFAVLSVDRDTSSSQWFDVGSIAPDDSSVPVWIRAKAIAEAALEKLRAVVDPHRPDTTGLLVVFEHPTPREDRLVTLNRVLHLVLFGSGIHESFAGVQVLSLNASTLRSLMGLTSTGSKNKADNKERAYDFLARVSFPNLDSDACDAVLLATVASSVARLLMGDENIPAHHLARLCDASLTTKGKGRNQQTIVEGVLHRREYFYAYTPQTYSVALKDARAKTRTMERRRYRV